MRSCMAGCFFGASVCAAKWTFWRLRGCPRRVGVASILPRSNHKKRKCRTADDGSSIDDRDDVIGEFTLARLRTHTRIRGLLSRAPLPCTRITTVSVSALAQPLHYLVATAANPSITAQRPAPVATWPRTARLRHKCRYRCLAACAAPPPLRGRENLSRSRGHIAAVIPLPPLSRGLRRTPAATWPRAPRLQPRSCHRRQAVAAVDSRPAAHPGRYVAAGPSAAAAPTAPSPSHRRRRHRYHGRAAASMLPSAHLIHHRDLFGAAPSVFDESSSGVRHSRGWCTFYCHGYI